MGDSKLLSDFLSENSRVDIELAVGLQTYIGKIAARDLSADAIRALLEICQLRLMPKLSRFAHIELMGLLKDLDELECDLLMKGFSMELLQEQVGLIQDLEKSFQIPPNTEQYDQGMILEQAIPIEQLDTALFHQLQEEERN